VPVPSRRAPCSTTSRGMTFSRPQDLVPLAVKWISH